MGKLLLEKIIKIYKNVKKQKTNETIDYKYVLFNVKIINWIFLINL